nr:hypothetical protein CFP56_02750 [Quercus suber]
MCAAPSKRVDPGGGWRMRTSEGKGGGGRGCRRGRRRRDERDDPVFTLPRTVAPALLLGGSVRRCAEALHWSCPAASARRPHLHLRPPSAPNSTASSWEEVRRRR